MDLDVHLDAIVAGSHEAFAAWLAGAEPSLRASLRSFATTVDVEVVVQETLLRAWQFAPRVKRDGRGNSLLRYALRTGRNLAIDHTRKHARDVDVDEVPEVPVAPVEPDPALKRWLLACIEALPERARLALMARLNDRGTRHDRDLAATVDMRLNTFLKNVGRARAMVSKCLAERGVETT